jgi:hypothetical protein
MIGAGPAGIEPETQSPKGFPARLRSDSHALMGSFAGPVPLSILSHLHKKKILHSRLNCRLLGLIVPEVREMARSERAIDPGPDQLVRPDFSRDLVLGSVMTGTKIC